MDAVGASNPNNNLEFEQIELHPRDSLVKRKPNLAGNRMGKLTVGKSASERNSDILGETINTLEEVRKAFGMHTLKDFFLNMRRMFQMSLNRAMITNGGSQFNNNKKSELSKG